MLRNINILGFYVSDLARTAEFYAKLGFVKTHNDSTIVEFTLGSTKLQFMDREVSRKQGEKFTKEAFAEPKGTGLYINIEVDKIDEYYQSLRTQGLEPSTEPRNWPWGHREFVIRDPDRYKLVFYQKL